MDKNHEVFDDYVMGFDLNDSMIRYKYNHSYRVMKECKNLALELDFDEDGVFLAETIGLFHDIGRFKQLSSYNTLNDKISIDHGEVSCDILFKENVIDELEIPDASEEVISKAIFNHNKFKYDDNDYDEAEKIFCKLIRDADKIDIFNSFGDENLLDLEYDDSEISEDVKKEFFENKSVDFNKVKNKNDRVIEIISFIYDLNFDYSKKKILDEKYLDKIYDRVDKEIFKEYYDHAIKYLKDGEKDA